MMYENIDFNRLRNDMIDFYGTAMHNGSPAAMMDMMQIERASDSELLRIAQNNRVNLRSYEVDSRNRFDRYL